MIFFSSSIYEWSTVLPVNSALKRAADFVLCSMCMIQPAHFDSLLQWMGVMVGGPVELQASITGKYTNSEILTHFCDVSIKFSPPKGNDKLFLFGLPISISIFKKQKQLDSMYFLQICFNAIYLMPI